MVTTSVYIICDANIDGEEWRDMMFCLSTVTECSLKKVQDFIKHLVWRSYNFTIGFCCSIPFNYIVCILCHLLLEDQLASMNYWWPQVLILWCKHWWWSKSGGIWCSVFQRWPKVHWKKFKIFRKFGISFNI